jgi:O-acetyl-ADP-ribose deacetylase (regulator of RNase III)
MSYTEIKGDLIELAKQGKFDVIAHGCNCFCTMGAGIAVPMKVAFGCDKFQMERTEERVYSSVDDEVGYTRNTGNRGDISKLGNIDYENILFNTKTGRILIGYSLPKPEFIIEFTVVNAYTQYHYGRNHKDGVQTPIDYEALTLCMRKMNSIFRGMRIGLPMIGAGLAGGDWERIKTIIQTELKDCDTTIVIFNK